MLQYSEDTVGFIYRAEFEDCVWTFAHAAYLQRATHKRSQL